MDAVEPAGCFSETWAIARRRFRDAALRAGARIDTLTLDAVGPDGDVLAIDLAWLGASIPTRVLIHVSGVHGVEGFAGSAIQIQALEEGPAPAPDSALVFVHALNPYGMAWLRRVNEHNVDLNRNFIDTPSECWSGADSLYGCLDRFLNPRRIGLIDTFYPEAVKQIARYGMRALRRAIASGQYEYPKGLFFGGHGLEQGPALYRRWLAENLATAQSVFVIDVHTGLGRWAANSLAHKRHGTHRGTLPKAIERHLVPDFEASFYPFKGAHANVYLQALKSASVDFITQEFGTFSSIRVLKALRAENQVHHSGNADISHRSKVALKDAFCPRSRAWRASIVEDGLTLFSAAARHHI